MNTNENIQDDIDLTNYLKNLKNFLVHLAFENFEGHYDSLNISNCLEHFDILNDYYPYPVRNHIRTILLSGSFNDWRNTPIQSSDRKYLIYEQEISNHTFCESAERNLLGPAQSSTIIGLDSHSLGVEFNLSIDTNTVSVSSLLNVSQIFEWFSRNRLPKRNFQVTKKHGENNNKVKIVNNKEESPLRTTEEKASKLLQTAIGTSNKELFNIDQENGGFIIFKWEGPTPQNMYHGYSVSDDSKEIPDQIKSILVNMVENIIK